MDKAPEFGHEGWEQIGRLGLAGCFLDKNTTISMISIESFIDHMCSTRARPGLAQR
jgi:hypothetical protein